MNILVNNYTPNLNEPPNAVHYYSVHSNLCTGTQTAKLKYFLFQFPPTPKTTKYVLGVIIGIII